LNRRQRVILIAELVLGVIPVTAFYVYFFPVGYHWV
jgi:hypothetical protein